MKKLVLILVICCNAVISKAGDGDYAVSKIPAALLENANAVKRLEEIRFEVFNKVKAVHYYKVAYTILNENGNDFARCVEYYDKLRSINFIEGRLFDAEGKKIRTLKKSDIQDRSGTDEGTLADDNRIKFHNFYYKSYPYTIEYEVEIKYNYTMFYPRWLPQEDDNLSVQSSTMTVIMPQDMDLRYKAMNISGEPTVAKGGSSKTYTWQIKDKPAIEREPYSPHWYEIAPVLYTGPVQFGVQGYEGNMSSWQDFGKFVYALKADRDQLPDNIKTTVHQLTDTVTDVKRKIAILYNFLQKNTHYISIQLGIGGWQPFDAQYVATKRYGDCKALSNYMYSLLKEAGIKSYYTLIKSGVKKPFFISDFPCSQFDHVIVNVPLKKDTVWLECTDQTLPAGYLSGFTSDRYALTIDETGGTLVRTPKYGLKENMQVRKIEADIDMEGKLTTTVVTVYKARQEDEIHSLINGQTRDKVLEHLKTEINLPNYDVANFNYEEKAASLPSITETLNINAEHYAQVSGKRIFVPYNILSRSGRKLSANPTRKYDIEFNYEYTDIDTVEIKVPAGFKPESIPPDITLTSDFGRYTASVKFENDKIIYYRRMEQLSGRFPVKEYNEAVKFYEQIYKADHSKVVLVKA